MTSCDARGRGRNRDNPPLIINAIRHTRTSQDSAQLGGNFGFFCFLPYREGLIRGLDERVNFCCHTMSEVMFCWQTIFVAADFCYL